MQKSESINELATALSKAQSKIKGAIKDSTNPFFKSSYADLTSVIEAIKGPFAENGLSVSQLTDYVDGVTLVETVIMHSSGQWISGTMPVKVKDDSPQALGSGISYSRRYALQAAAGVPSLDDDAQAAQGQRPQPPVQRTATQPRNDANPGQKTPVNDFKRPGFGVK